MKSDRDRAVFKGIFQVGLLPIAAASLWTGQVVLGTMILGIWLGMELRVMFAHWISSGIPDDEAYPERYCKLPGKPRKKE